MMLLYFFYFWLVVTLVLTPIMVLSGYHYHKVQFKWNYLRSQQKRIKREFFWSQTLDLADVVLAIIVVLGYSFIWPVRLLILGITGLLKMFAKAIMNKWKKEIGVLMQTIFNFPD